MSVKNIEAKITKQAKAEKPPKPEPKAEKPSKPEPKAEKPSKPEPKAEKPPKTPKAEPKIAKQTRKKGVVEIDGQKFKLLKDKVKKAPSAYNLFIQEQTKNGLSFSEAVAKYKSSKN